MPDACRQSPNHHNSTKVILCLFANRANVKCQLPQTIIKEVEVEISDKSFTECSLNRRRITGFWLFQNDE